MLTEKRRAQILSALRQDGLVSIQELSQRFDVSYMTIWRDLDVLVEQGYAQRVRGGAIAAPGETHTPVGSDAHLLPGFDPQADPYYRQKMQIGRYAARHLVDEGDTIMIEAGTTASSMASFLNQPNLTVLTNGLLTSMMIFPNLRNVTLMCSGGVLIETGAFIGPQSEDFFTHYRVKKAFFGAMGVTLDDGFTDPTPLYTRLKGVMRQNADMLVMMVDASKLGTRSLVRVLKLEEVNILVTDSGAPPDILAGLRQRGIDVRVADEE